ncbi:MAG: aminotransferase class V-fold PLP-dependent enzyme [Thermomicrobiales bacterium]
MMTGDDGRHRAQDAGPRTIAAMIDLGLDRMEAWEAGWRAFPVDASWDVDAAAMSEAIEALTERLTDNYPFFHPDYAAQMLMPPHPVAAAAYAIAQRINPNAHANDGGPATTRLEIEVVDTHKAMFGYNPKTSLGHLTSSGTIANLEALWVSRELHPDKSIAYSRLAHYTHARMCDVLRMEGVAIEPDALGRIDLDALERALKSGRVGTVVATAGSTGTGSVDQVDEIVPLAQRYGVRVHVDAAYGGYFVLLAGTDALDPAVARAFRAIRDADSIVVDPHKRGLQPYGCGSVFSGTRRSGGSTSTTRRTPISPRRSCTWERSVSNARGQARRQRRSGRRCGSCLWKRNEAWGRCWRAPGGRRCVGRS